MDKDTVHKLLDAAVFRFAKSMPKNPHEYSHRENWNKDSDFCNQLGMDAEEILKLKHITGFSKLFENVEYKKSWETKHQIQHRLNMESENAK